MKSATPIEVPDNSIIVAYMEPPLEVSKQGQDAYDYEKSRLIGTESPSNTTRKMAMSPEVHRAILAVAEDSPWLPATEKRFNAPHRRYSGIGEQWRFIWRFGADNVVRRIDLFKEIDPSRLDPKNEVGHAVVLVGRDSTQALALTLYPSSEDHPNRMDVRMAAFILNDLAVLQRKGQELAAGQPLASSKMRILSVHANGHELHIGK